MKSSRVSIMVTGVGLTVALAFAMAKPAEAQVICGESFIILPNGQCQNLSYLTEMGRQGRTPAVSPGVTQPQAQNVSTASGQTVIPKAQGRTGAGERSLWRQHIGAMEMMGRAFR